MENQIKQWRTEDIVNNLLLLKGMVLLGESEKFKKEWKPFVNQDFELMCSWILILF